MYVPRPTRCRSDAGKIFSTTAPDLGGPVWRIHESQSAARPRLPQAIIGLGEDPSRRDAAIRIVSAWMCRVQVKLFDAERVEDGLRRVVLLRLDRHCKFM